MAETLNDMMSVGANDGKDKHYFGEIVEVDDWDCILAKGQGAIPFDPTSHRPEQRRIKVKIVLSCEKQDGSKYLLEQSDITSSSKMRVTLKSLAALNIETRDQLRGLVGKWAEVTRVATGQKYEARKGAMAGQMIDETALNFLRLFADRDAAKDAETEFYTPRNGANANGDGRNVPQPLSADEVGAIDAAARAQLLATLPMLWQAASAAPNPVKMLETILAGNPAYKAAGIDIWCDEAQRLHGQVPF
jgi:hypothetical protein